jgi:large-conductance mechanosensitive channel
VNLKKLVFFLLIAFMLFFLVQSPNEAAKLVQMTGENAQELFSAAGDAFVRFMKTLI